MRSGGEQRRPEGNTAIRHLWLKSGGEHCHPTFAVEEEKEEEAEEEEERRGEERRGEERRGEERRGEERARQLT